LGQNELLVLLTRNSAHAYALSMCGPYRRLIDRDDILSAADLGLLRGAKCFKPDMASFATWSFYWVRREVRRLIGREVTWKSHTAPFEFDDLLSGDDPHAWLELAELARELEPETLRLLEGRLGRLPTEDDPSAPRLTAAQIRRRLRRLRDAVNDTSKPRTRRRPKGSCG